MKRLFAVIAVLAALLAAPQQADAGIDSHQQTITISSGTATTSATFPLAATEIKAVYVDVPTMDAGDVTTMSLQINLGGTDVTPVGWTDLVVGATDDGAVNKSGALSVFVDSGIWFEITAGSTQAAPREFTVWYYIRH